jgi:hypothetical protein
MRQVGGLQKVFRKINQAAYLVSVPFLAILILGAVLQSRQLAILGATAVVLLNISAGSSPGPPIWRSCRYGTASTPRR